MNTPRVDPRRPASSRWQDVAFWSSAGGIGLAYLLFVVFLVFVDLQFTTWQDIRAAIADPRIRFSLQWSLVSCTLSALVATWIAVPTGYVLARSDPDQIRRHLGDHPWLMRLCLCVRETAEILGDIPIVLPPLVVGISLLLFFQTPLGRWCDSAVGDACSWLGFPEIRGITYEMPAVVFAQATVATAFAIRVMRVTFGQIDAEPERMALVLGANRLQAFSHIALPQAAPGVISAFTLAWARSLGEFGPVLIFAGTAAMKTEVLATTVYLRFSIGDLRGAVAASVLLLSLAAVVLIITRATQQLAHTST